MLSLEGTYYPNSTVLDYTYILYIHTYIHTYMCHGAGANVGWFKEYRGLTFTM